MTKRIIHALALALAVTFMWQDTALADSNRRVEVRNETSVTMLEFYASTVSSGTWEEDIFGNDVLRSGGRMNIHFNDNSGYCLYDFKAVLTGGGVVVREDVDICEVDSWTVQ